MLGEGKGCMGEPPQVMRQDLGGLSALVALGSNCSYGLDSDQICPVPQSVSYGCHSTAFPRDVKGLHILLLGDHQSCSLNANSFMT